MTLGGSTQSSMFPAQNAYDEIQRQHNDAQARERMREEAIKRDEAMKKKKAQEAEEKEQLERLEKEKQVNVQAQEVETDNKVDSEVYLLIKSLIIAVLYL